MLVAKRGEDGEDVLCVPLEEGELRQVLEGMVWWVDLDGGGRENKSSVSRYRAADEKLLSFSDLHNNSSNIEKIYLRNVGKEEVDK